MILAILLLVGGLGLDSGPSLPSRCTVGDRFYKTTAPKGDYYCGPTSNTWTAIVAGAAVTGGTCSTHQFARVISTAGVPTCAQPAATDVSGLAASATTDATNASNISAGTVGPARLGSGTPSSSTWLRGDGAWETLPAAGGAAPDSATFITQTPDASLSAEQALSALGTGLLKNTTTTGVLSIFAGSSCTNQFVRSLNASGAATCASVTPSDASGWAASATTDTTDAGNISSGTLANARTTAASANTASAIVARDGSGDFSAGTITATFAGNLTGNVTGNVSGTAGSATGNAATATALAGNGSNCSAGSFARGVDAGGAAENCTVAFVAADVPAAETDAAHDACSEISGCVVGAITSAGNAATATALAADPADCAAGQVATGINASGTLACTATPTLTTVTAALTGNASTATALAADGGNCSAGSFPLGVDASGAVQSCTVAFTSAGVPAAETDAAHDTCAEISGCVVGAVTAAGVPAAETNSALSSVTNDAQTKAAIVPNTAPSAGQVLVGNAGGTAYAKQSMSQDCTMTSAGVVTCTKTNNASFAASATTDTTTPTYITETASGNLSAEFAMGSLANGLVLNATTTGVPSIYGGTSCTNQFARSLNASGAATCNSVATTDLASQAARSVLGNATAAAAVPTATTTVDVLAYQTAEIPSFARVATSDFTTAANTNLQAITGLTWTMPASTAINIPFSCFLQYSIATAAVAVSFGIQDVSIAPTAINAQGLQYTSATAATEGTMVNLASTTATAIVTATPSAVTTVWMAQLHGMIEQPSNASSSAINIMVKTATAADVVSVKRGSFCTVGF